MELRQLRCFVRVVELGKLSRTAADLGLVTLRNHGALLVGRTLGEASNCMHRIERSSHWQLATTAARAVAAAGLPAQAANAAAHQRAGSSLVAAQLINVARGKLVVECELLAEQPGAHLGGTFLEVFEHKPPPADSQLWALPGVMITPH